MGSPAFNPSGDYSAVTFDPKAAYDAAPAATPPKEGFIHSLASQFGLTPEQAQAAHDEMMAHPLKAAAKAALGPAGAFVEGLYNQVKQSGSALGDAATSYAQGNAPGMVANAVKAIPIVGPAMDKAADQYADKNYAGEAGTLTGAAAQAAPMVAGAVDSALPNRTPIPNPSLPNAMAKFRPKSSPAIVPPEEVQAQKIAQSILPPGGIKPEQVQAIQAEAPAIKEYAQRTGNPLNTQAEGLKAAQAVAQEGLDHFNNNILGPVAKDSVNLGAGKTDLGNSATLGQISDEISSLNKQVNTAKAASAGDALTMMAKKGGVMDQLQYLRGVLYDNLSSKTGIPPADLQSLREGYGGQFTTADALESAQSARLTRTGRASQGVQTIGSVPTSLADIPGKLYTAAKGGEQAISDRQFSSAMADVQPQAPTRPIPNPPTTFPASVRGGALNQPPATTVVGPDYTPDANAAADLRKASVARFNAARAAEAEAQRQRNLKRTGVTQ